jgi:hypothetical protein
VARTIRVIGKGDMGRLVPIPESFLRVLGIQLAGKPAMEYLFAKVPGGGQSYGPGDGLSNGPNNWSRVPNYYHVIT